MKKIALSLLAGGILAVPVLADTVSTAVNVTNNAGSPFYAAGPDQITDSDGNSYYAAFNPSSGWPISIKDYIGRTIVPRDFGMSDNATDLCNDLIDVDDQQSYADGVLLAGIQIDPGSVIHLTFDAPEYLTNLNDPNYKIQVTNVYTHMCYYYNSEWKDISQNATIDDMFDFFNSAAEYRNVTVTSSTEIDTDVPIPNLTGESQPSSQATIYFLFDPVYKFPTSMKSGTYKGDFVITLSAE